MTRDLKHLLFDPANRIPLLKDRDISHGKHQEARKEQSPKSAKQRASILFIGTATTIIEWEGFRVLTDPNFLHAGDHVHLGPGVSATRQTNPAIDLGELPDIDCILLSHYHEDHFDRLVEDSLTRDFPIITTSHAKECLTSPARQDDPFTRVTSLDPFEGALLHIAPGSKTEKQEGSDRRSRPAIKVTGMPGQHVPPGPLSAINNVLGAVPPTNGWLLELGTAATDGEAGDLSHAGYRIYISGDTVFYDELREIPKRLGGKTVDLMLIHLGGTTIPGPSAPLVMVTMDAKQGVQLMRLVRPDMTIPIHFDDYDMFMSPLADFKNLVKDTEFRDRVTYLDRGEVYEFEVR